MSFEKTIQKYSSWEFDVVKYYLSKICVISWIKTYRFKSLVTSPLSSQRHNFIKEPLFMVYANYFYMYYSSKVRP